MSLMLAVYLLGVLDPLRSLLEFIAGFSIVATLGAIMWCFENFEYSWNKDKDGNFNQSTLYIINVRRQLLKFAPITAVVVSLIAVAVPTQKTGYMMLGAYVGEEIVKSKTAENFANGTTEILGKVNTIVNQKLDEYIKESDNKEVKK